MATMIRVELLTPQGGMVSSETYNKLFTMHGVAMIFFFLIPSIPAVLGNFFLPMMIGARDLAFPRLNLLSWYLLVIGGLFALFAMLAGGVDTGWTFYTPYSTTYSNSWVIATALGIFVAGFSSILTGLNFIVTVHRMRAPGHDVVPAAAVRVGPLCHRPDPGSGNAGAGGDHRSAAVRAVTPYRDIRSGAGRRPGVVPAHVLVLLAPGGVYHGAAGHGSYQRTDFDVFAQADLRIQDRGVFERGHRGARLPGVGPPHVCQHAVAIRRDGVFVPELLRGDPVGHQGFQLDGHAVQGVHLLRHAHAICVRLHRAVHHRRVDGAVRGLPGNRRSRHRHVLRGGALPLHHGGWRYHGIPGRPALLVAEDDRADVPGDLGQAFGAASSSWAST